MKDPIIKSNSLEDDLMQNPAKTNTGISELDILRKAYELILENSDLFFKELGNAFNVEKERNEFRPLI
jgi:hypothetical protein